MEVELKTVKLTKSKIQQMDFIGIPLNPLAQVIGWVNISKDRYVIVKIGDCYYRGWFIKKINKHKEMTQFLLDDGGWESPLLTKIICTVFNNRSIGYAVDRDEDENMKLYDNILNYKRKTEIAGQIYY